MQKKIPPSSFVTAHEINGKIYSINNIQFSNILYINVGNLTIHIRLYRYAGKQALTVSNGTVTVNK